MDKYTAVCYRFYDKSGRRLALFCDFKDATTAQIYTLPCSKDELFKKSFAKEAYKKFLETGVLEKSATLTEVEVKPEEGTLKTLFRYAYNNLYYPVNYAKVTVKTKYKKLNHG